jgi:hypothetical protein
VDEDVDVEGLWVGDGICELILFYELDLVL